MSKRSEELTKTQNETSTWLNGTRILESYEASSWTGEIAQPAWLAKWVGWVFEGFAYSILFHWTTLESLQSCLRFVSATPLLSVPRPPFTYSISIHFRGTASGKPRCCRRKRLTLLGFTLSKAVRRTTSRQLRFLVKKIENMWNPPRGCNTYKIYMSQSLTDQCL